MAWSYGQALAYPGSASASVRSIEWLRDHHGGGLVDRVEVWYFTRRHPPTKGVPSGPFPPAPTAAESAVIATALAEHRGPELHPAVHPTLPGEAMWRPGPGDSGGRPTYYTTYWRPEKSHPTVVAGALWIDQRAARLDLFPGTREPGGTAWPGGGQAPPTAVAAFNSGFLLRSSGGGFFKAGRTARALAPGAASLVIAKDGHAELGALGTSVKLERDTYAVRQNLALIVVHGRPVPGLVHNTRLRWGSRKSQLEYVWRSGIGIDRAGHLIYVGGNNFTLTTLADALTQAGAVRAMQLDIHTQMVSANLFRRTGTGVAATKLLPWMQRPATRYQQSDQRDFFAVLPR